MKNSVKSKLTVAKNHLVNNRGRYCFATGLIAGSYVTAAAIGWNELIQEAVSEAVTETIETTV